MGHEHLPPIFNQTEIEFTVTICLISYPLAASLFFYLKDFSQKFNNPLLFVSFLGSVFFSILLTSFDYANTIIELKNYKKPLLWISGDFGPPKPPNTEETVVFIIAMSIAAFLNTGLTYFFVRNFYNLFFVSKNEVDNNL